MRACVQASEKCKSVLKHILPCLGSISEGCLLPAFHDEVCFDLYPHGYCMPFLLQARSSVSFLLSVLPWPLHFVFPSDYGLCSKITGIANIIYSLIVLVSMDDINISLVAGLSSGRAKVERDSMANQSLVEQLTLPMGISVILQRY